MLRVFMLVITLIFILSCGDTSVTSSAINPTDNTITPINSTSAPVLATIYVDASATGNNNGTSWNNAFKDLQDGIDYAATKATGNGVVRVHVAIGTYKPSNCPVDNADNNKCFSSDKREQHFSLKNDVEVYGGYPKGGGTSATANESQTILSGDIGTTNDSDNVYHVFYHLETAKLTSSAKLENVTITKGNANGDIPNVNDIGGGMINWSSSITLTKVTFKDNKAKRLGGGMFNNNNSNLTLTEVTFIGNIAEVSGGGMFNVNNSKPTLTNCTFTGNTAKTSGGAIYSWANSTPTFIGKVLAPTDAKLSQTNGYFKEVQ